MPEIGEKYELYQPWGTVEVTSIGKVWIHIKPGDGRASFDGDVVQPRGKIPTRIKRKHWALKLKKKEA